MYQDANSPLALDVFRRKVGFLGILGIAFTCSVYLMTLLRPVLEPFLWALFLVMALQPISNLFESCLMGLGGLCCGRAGPRRAANRRRGCCCRILNCADEEMIELTEGDPGPSGLREEDPSREVDVCWECWGLLARVVSVASALAVVFGLLIGMATFVFDGAVRVKENFPVYEQGARNAAEYVKELIEKVKRGSMPKAMVDELAENLASNGKALISDLVGQLLSHAGHLLVEVLMLGLYVMFWLCTPMPMNPTTQNIFRRYLFLKGAACTCYGVCVGLLLHFLEIELAVLFGLTSFFFSFIPEVGAFIGMALPAPVILFDSRLSAPMYKLIFATLGQLALKFVFANIIEVKLVENDATMKMHPVITLLAVTFFGFIWGPTGMLLSVPIMAYFKVIVASDLVPPEFRDPILVLIEGDRNAPERHRKRLGEAVD